MAESDLSNKRNRCGRPKKIPFYDFLTPEEHESYEKILKIYPNAYTVFEKEMRKRKLDATTEKEEMLSMVADLKDEVIRQSLEAGEPKGTEDNFVLNSDLAKRGKREVQNEKEKLNGTDADIKKNEDEKAPQNPVSQEKPSLTKSEMLKLTTKERSAPVQKPPVEKDEQTSLVVKPEVREEVKIPVVQTPATQPAQQVPVVQHQQTQTPPLHPPGNPTPVKNETIHEDADTTKNIPQTDQSKVDQKPKDVVRIPKKPAPTFGQPVEPRRVVAGSVDTVEDMLGMDDLFYISEFKRVTKKVTGPLLNHVKEHFSNL